MCPLGRRGQFLPMCPAGTDSPAGLTWGNGDTNTPATRVSHGRYDRARARRHSKEPVQRHGRCTHATTPCGVAAPSAQRAPGGTERADAAAPTCPPSGSLPFVTRETLMPQPGNHNMRGESQSEVDS